MLNLPQKTLTNIKRLLLRKQREINKNLKEVEKDDPVKEDGLDETTEPGMASWLAEAHGRAVALGGELKNVAVSIKNALSKIRRGTYGKCEKCGQQIDTRRLLAMPMATLCLSCSSKTNKK